MAFDLAVDISGENQALNSRNSKLAEEVIFLEHDFRLSPIEVL